MLVLASGLALTDLLWRHQSVLSIHQNLRKVNRNSRGNFRKLCFNVEYSVVRCGYLSLFSYSWQPHNSNATLMENINNKIQSATYRFWHFCPVPSFVRGPVQLKKKPKKKYFFFPPQKWRELRASVPFYVPFWNERKRRNEFQWLWRYEPAEGSLLLLRAIGIRMNHRHEPAS